MIPLNELKLDKKYDFKYNNKKIDLKIYKIKILFISSNDFLIHVH